VSRYIREVTERLPWASDPVARPPGRLGHERGEGQPRRQPGVARSLGWGAPSYTRERSSVVVPYTRVKPKALELGCKQPLRSGGTFLVALACCWSFYVAGQPSRSAMRRVPSASSTATVRIS
jgi:hypothetical protein